ncbi:MAG: right-handed parallel beta-helix repeat-containing protein [Abditibacteriota bacterium]|nr:right-handed parallel beta-helix repeat-containing protein [Abditibacteriota bacterium]
MRLKVFLALIAVFAALFSSGCADKGKAADGAFSAAAKAVSAPADTGAAQAAGKIRPIAKPAKDIPFVTLSCKKGEDITQTLRDTLTDKRRILIPKGTYRITGPVSVPSDTVIKGEPGTVLKVGGFPKKDVMYGAIPEGAPLEHVFEVSGARSENGGPAEPCDNVTIANLSFVAAEKSSSWAAVMALSVRSLTLENLDTDGMSIACLSLADRLRNGRLSFFSRNKITSDEYLNRNVMILNCSANGKGKERVGAGIFIEYCRDFAVSGCRIENCRRGIELHGGEQQRVNYEKDSFVTVKSGAVTGCSVRKVEDDGIFAQRCDFITIKDCRVSDSRMGAGISFLGSGDFRAEGCRVSDCQTGYCTGQNCSGNIAIVNCRSDFAGRKAGYGARHYRNGNSDVIPSSARIVIENCEFEGNIAGYIGLSGPAKGIVFKHNRCVNAMIEVLEDNINGEGIESNITVEKNTFEDHTEGIDSLTAAIYAYIRTGTSLSVTGNTFKGDHGLGISIIDASPGGGGKAHIDGNTLEGYNTDISVGARNGITVTGGDFRGEIQKI